MTGGSPEDILAGSARPHLARGVRLHHDTARDRWILLAPETLIEPNPVALEIIRRCTGAATLDQIIADLVALSGAAPERVAADTRMLLNQMVDRRLMVMS